MRELLVVCDHCGKEMKGQCGVGHLVDIRAFKLYDKYENQIESIDLCDDCYRELIMQVSRFTSREEKGNE